MNHQAQEAAVDENEGRSQNKPEEIGQSQRELPEVGRWVATTLAAGAFACLLTLVGIGETGVWTQWTAIFLATSLPLLGGYVLLHVDHQSKYRITKLIKIIPLIGMLLSVLGIAGSICMVSSVGGIIFITLSAFCALVYSNAEKRTS